MCIRDRQSQDLLVPSGKILSIEGEELRVQHHRYTDPHSSSSQLYLYQKAFCHCEDHNILKNTMMNQQTDVYKRQVNSSKDNICYNWKKSVCTQPIVKTKIKNNYGNYCHRIHENPIRILVFRWFFYEIMDELHSFCLLYTSRCV